MQNTIYYRVSFETFIDNFARKLISSTVKISDTGSCAPSLDLYSAGEIGANLHPLD